MKLSKPFLALDKAPIPAHTSASSLTWLRSLQTSTVIGGRGDSFLSLSTSRWTLTHRTYVVNGCHLSDHPAIYICSTNSNSLHDVTEAKFKLPFNLSTGTRIDDGSIIPVTTNNPINYPLPWCEWQRRPSWNLRLRFRSAIDSYRGYKSKTVISTFLNSGSFRPDNSSNRAITEDLRSLDLQIGAFQKVAKEFNLFSF